MHAYTLVGNYSRTRNLPTRPSGVMTRRWNERCRTVLAFWHGLILISLMAAMRTGRNETSAGDLDCDHAAADDTGRLARDRAWRVPGQRTHELGRCHR